VLDPPLWQRIQHPGVGYRRLSSRC
jgi:hypothetical protein